MATYKTDQAYSQDNRVTLREQHPSARTLQQPVRFAKFTITQTAALVAADIIKLGSLQQDGAVIIPEQCRIVGSSASAKFNATLQSVTGTASAVDESTAVTHNGASAKITALTRTAAGTNTSLDASAYLQILIATVTSFAGGSAADTLTFEIAYRVEKSAG